MQNESFGEPTKISFKDNIRNFYNKNKLSIFSFLFILILFFFATGFYLHSQESKRLLLADLYIQSKIDLNNNNKNEAKKSLIKIIESNDKTYSVLSLFLLINYNLIENDQKLVELFDHVLNNNEFENEIKNLIILKKTFIKSNFANETELLKDLQPLINSETLWRSHALLLLGDYFLSKGELRKAKESYVKILSLTDTDNLHEQVKYRLQLRSYD